MAKAKAKLRTFKLAPDEAKKDWALKEDGKSRAVRRFAKKADGEKFAKEYVKKAAPSKLVLYKADGSLQRDFTY